MVWGLKTDGGSKGNLCAHVEHGESSGKDDRGVSTLLGSGLFLP